MLEKEARRACDKQAAPRITRSPLPTRLGECLETYRHPLGEPTISCRDRLVTCNHDEWHPANCGCYGSHRNLSTPSKCLTCMMASSPSNIRCLGSLASSLDGPFFSLAGKVQNTSKLGRTSVQGGTQTSQFRPVPLLRCGVSKRSAL